MKNQIIVQGINIGIDFDNNENDYLSLTDIVSGFEGGSALIEQWLRNKDTILFLGTWEKLYNPNFNSIEFEGIKNEAGTGSYFLSVKKWTEKTGATGIKARAGRYGGTFAHKDIAFEFCSWLSPEFKLYLIKEYQRLRIIESQRNSIDWQLKREISKANYKIHTDSIKSNLITPQLTKGQIKFTYATEADLLNMALFGMTAATWKSQNKGQKGNIRDYATIEQLIILSNLESTNALLIHSQIEQARRLELLNQMAIQQSKSLLDNVNINNIKMLNEGNDEQ